MMFTALIPVFILITNNNEVNGAVLSINQTNGVEAINGSSIEIMCTTDSSTFDSIDIFVLDVNSIVSSDLPVSQCIIGAACTSGSVSPTSSTYAISLSGSDVKIVSQEINLDDEKWWICASSTNPSDAKNFFVSVIVPVTSVTINNAGARNVTVGQPFTITCTTSYCKPAAEIKISKELNGNTTVVSDNITTSYVNGITTGTYLYTPTIDDGGASFSCEAKNSLTQGTATSPGNITISVSAAHSTSTASPGSPGSTASTVPGKSSTGLATWVIVVIVIVCVLGVIIIIIIVVCCLGYCNPLLLKFKRKDNSGRIDSEQALPMSEKEHQNGNTHGNVGRVDNGSIVSSSNVHTTHVGTNIESDDKSPKRADDHAARQTLPRDQTSLPPIKSLDQPNKHNEDKSRNKRGLSANLESSDGLPPYETRTTASTTTYMIQMEKDTSEAQSEKTTQHYPRTLPPIPDSDRSQNDAINDASDSSVSPRKLPEPPELDNNESNTPHKTKKRKKKNRRSREGEDVEEQP